MCNNLTSKNSYNERQFNVNEENFFFVTRTFLKVLSRFVSKFTTSSL